MTYAIVVLSLICCTQGARILGIYPLPGNSHYYLGSSLFRELAERGHDVTVINTFGEKDPPTNGTYRDILLTGLFEEKTKDKSKARNMFKRADLNPFSGALFVAKMANKFIGTTLNHPNVQELLHSDEEFDVVIVDNFLSDAYKAFATHFDCPLIAISPVGPNFWINPFVGNPSPPSYVPNILDKYYPPMSFWDRMMNSLLDAFNYLIYHYYVYPQQNEFVRQYIPRGGDLYDILYNVSLVLLNSHPSLSLPQPTVPNMVEVGGMHVKPPKELPADLKEFFDSAKDGVIYFSMGTNLKGVQWTPEKRQAFVDAFSKLKQQVLWKWEDDELPGRPENVKTVKWAPQMDVLAHPNLKLFITHGGFMSSVESAYNGVPVLMIPIFGDQPSNAHFAEKNGFGRFITFSEISEGNILRTINEMITNSKYKENALKRRNLYHDRQVNPMETAVYWVEYVIRHRGAPHLRVAGVDIPWYQYFLLDVILAFSIFLVISFLAVRRICRKLCLKKKKSQKQKRH